MAGFSNIHCPLLAITRLNLQVMDTRPPCLSKTTFCLQREEARVTSTHKPILTDVFCDMKNFGPVLHSSNFLDGGVDKNTSGHLSRPWPGQQWRQVPDVDRMHEEDV